MRQVVAGGHEPQIPCPAAEPISPVQLLVRADPSGGYDVYPLPAPLGNVEDLLAERGIDLCHGTVRFWWNRFGPMFESEVRRRRVDRMRGFRHWRWHVDELHLVESGSR